MSVVSDMVKTWHARRTKTRKKRHAFIRVALPPQSLVTRIQPGVVLRISKETRRLRLR